MRYNITTKSVYHFVNLIKSIHVCSFSVEKIRFESSAKSNKKDEV